MYFKNHLWDSPKMKITRCQPLKFWSWVPQIYGFNKHCSWACCTWFSKPTLNRHQYSKRTQFLLSPRAVLSFSHSTKTALVKTTNDLHVPKSLGDAQSLSCWPQLAVLNTIDYSLPTVDHFLPSRKHSLHLACKALISLGSPYPFLITLSQSSLLTLCS